ETEGAKKFEIKRISKDDFWALPVDIMAPCAKENTLTSKEAQVLNAKYVAEGANGPTTVDADTILRQKGIVDIPDILANSGGVLVSWMEMLQNIEPNGTPWSEEKVYARLHQLIRERLEQLYQYSNEHQISLRAAAHDVWLSTVKEKLDIGPA